MNRVQSGGSSAADGTFLNHRRLSRGYTIASSKDQGGSIYSTQEISDQEN